MRYQLQWIDAGNGQARYRVDEQFWVDLPAHTPPEQVASALLAALQADPAQWAAYQAQVARAAQLPQLRAQAATVLLEVDSDLTNTVQLRQMVAALLKKVVWLEAELAEVQAQVAPLPPTPPR
jgi:hypothetical protein